MRYTVNGALCAYVWRPIKVVGAPQALAGTLEMETSETSHLDTPALAPPDPYPPTLILTLQQGSDVAGRVWQWTISSQFFEVDISSPEELRMTLDETAKEFQQKIVDVGSNNNGTELWDALLLRAAA